MEGLSTAASTIAIVSIAADLLTGLTKLHALYQSIQDAPQEINSTIRDIQQLCTVIECIEQQQQRFAEPSLAAPLLSCSDKIAYLQNAAESISSGLNSAKRWERLWNAFTSSQKKDHFSRLRQSLEETKSTLILVLHLCQRDLLSLLHTHEINTLQNITSQVQDVKDHQTLLLTRVESMSQKLTSLNLHCYSEHTKTPLNTAHLERDCHNNCRNSNIPEVNYIPAGYLDNNQTKSQLISSISELHQRPKNIQLNTLSYLRTFFGSVVCRLEKRNTLDASCQTPQPQTTFSIILHPTLWNIRWALKFELELILSMSLIGWKYVVLPVRTVCDNSPLFQFCKAGNLNAVRGLFSKGNASILDTNSHGCQPLHYAVMNRDIQMSKFLIEQGANKCSTTYSGELPLGFISLASSEWMAFVRLFDDVIDFSTPMFCGWQLLWSFEVLDYGSTLSSCLEWLFRQYLDSTFDQYDNYALYHAYFGSVMRNDFKAASMIVKLCPEISKHHGRSVPILSLLPYHLVGSSNTFEVIINSGVDFHQIWFNETATSRAMRYWKFFRFWRYQLATHFNDAHETCMGETDAPWKPLRCQGWTYNTLQRLFALPLRVANSGLPDPLSCNHCEINIRRWDRSDILVDPWWEHLNRRIKMDQCVCLCLKKFPECIELPARATTADFCKLHDRLPADVSLDAIASQNSANLSVDCNICSIVGVVHGLDPESDTTSISPKASLRGESYIIISETGLSEGFHGDRPQKNNSQHGREFNKLNLGSRKNLTTLDWECFTGSKFPRRNDIMNQFVLHDGWKKCYVPGQLYCFECMSMFEGWTDDENYDTEHVRKPAKEKMPGSFPL